MPRITEQLAEQFVNQVARGAFEGVGPFAPAHEVAASALRDHTDPEAAISALVATHTRLAAAEGFATGLGGFMILPVALPANVIGFYTLAARLVGAIAHIRGHDISRRETRMAVLVSLTGDRASELLGRAGATLPAGRMTKRALRGLPDSTVRMVNKALGLKLLVTASGRGLVKLGRAVPLVGGVIGGTVDVALMRSIARHAREQFRTEDAPAGG